MPEKRSGEFLRGLAWNIPASIGAPADLAETVLNLGLAGGGYLGHKLGLLRADQLPQLLEGSPGTTKWWTKGTPMEESADPAFVRGQLTGGLAAAAYGMLPRMRMRQGQLNAITWHGSPHKFDKFDSTKIGTGEGAQAYGHGLYLAENPGVATQYKQAGNYDMPAAVTKTGQLLPVPRWSADLPPDEKAIRAIADAYSTASQKGVNAAAAVDAAGAQLTGLARESFNRLRSEIVGVNEVGNIYKVDLPDEMIARMLDWDKPLSQQASEVQKILETEAAKLAAQKSASARASFNAKLAAKGLPARFTDSGTPVDVSGWTGRQFHSAIENMLGGKVGVSEYLKAQGIPGIRYLDGGSRGAGAGTSNYVVFPGEEAQLRILERNGVPLQQGLAAQNAPLQKGLARGPAANSPQMPRVKKADMLGLMGSNAEDLGSFRAGDAVTFRGASGWQQGQVVGGNRDRLMIRLPDGSTALLPEGSVFPSAP